MSVLLQGKMGAGKTMLRVALLYFLAVFAAGFVLGTIRVLLLVDVLGERLAELVEMPVMAVVCALAAKYLIKRNIKELTATGAVLVGLMALAILLLFEFTVVLWLRDIPLSEYIANRDPVSGIAYLVGLAWYSVAPLLFYQYHLRHAPE
ncbi:MAG: hypothetical protein D9N11_01115 [Ketobacter sp.]|nr:MAG: hypothetical protein D9N11_01115 [Ketobacter sp.]